MFAFYVILRVEHNDLSLRLHVRPFPVAFQNFEMIIKYIAGLLPDVPRNRKYAKDQLNLMKHGIVPSDQWHDRKERETCSHEFSLLGKKLITIEKW